MEKYLEDMFRHLHVAYKNVESRLKAEGFKVRVLQVCRAWEEWTIYSRDFLQRLKNIFLGVAAVRPRFKTPHLWAQQNVDIFFSLA